MDCEKVVLGICCVKQASVSSTLQASLFAFPQFMAALALLAVVYTATDVRYRFRLSVVPLSQTVLCCLATAQARPLNLRERFSADGTELVTSAENS
jgi:hypothetical protein